MGQRQREPRETSHFGSGSQAAVVKGVVTIHNEGALLTGVALAHSGGGGGGSALIISETVFLHLAPCWTSPCVSTHPPVMWLLLTYLPTNQ